MINTSIWLLLKLHYALNVLNANTWWTLCYPILHSLNFASILKLSKNLSRQHFIKYHKKRNIAFQMLEACWAGLRNRIKIVNKCSGKVSPLVWKIARISAENILGTVHAPISIYLNECSLTDAPPRINRRFGCIVFLCCVLLLWGICCRFLFQDC